MSGLKIKKGDRVRVLSGKDRGKEGVVMRVIPKSNKVIGDLVLPNIATNNEGALVGLMAGATADVGVPNAAPPPFMLPTASLTAAPTANHFLKYPTLPPAAPSFPGNTFAHASLLRPANAGNDGALGTARLQPDAIYFLSANNQ